jgi:hypothetical protein
MLSVCVAPLLLLVLQVAASAGAGVLSSDISSWQPLLFAAAGQHLSAAALSQHRTGRHSSAAAAAGLAAAVGGAAASGAAEVGGWWLPAAQRLPCMQPSIAITVHATQHSDCWVHLQLLGNSSVLELQPSPSCCAHHLCLLCMPVGCVRVAEGPGHTKPAVDCSCVDAK